MAEESKVIDSRPWWQKKELYADMIYIAGATIALTPGAPVLFAVAGIQVTTIMIGVLTNGIGYLFGNYAKNDRLKRYTKAK